MLQNLLSDPGGIEIQMDHLGNIESSYRESYLTSDQIKSIKEIFSLAFTISDIELISTHSRDDLVNYSDTITISYKGQVPGVLRALFNLSQTYKFADYYVLKFDLTSKNLRLQFL